MNKPMRACASVVAALLTIFVLGCATADKAPPVVVQRVLQKPGQKSLTVTAVDNGASVVLDAAQMLVVRLPTSATSGLEWSLVDLKPGVLQVLNSRFERALRSEDAEESEGATLWQLQPQAAGNVSLSFELRKPHSLQPPVQTVRYEVSVK